MSEKYSQDLKTRQFISEVCDNLKCILLEKNLRYGNSALKPMEIFTKHAKINEDKAVCGMLYRLDDKLARVANSKELNKNDVFDIMGYLILLSVKKDWKFKDLLD